MKHKVIAFLIVFTVISGLIGIDANIKIGLAQKPIKLGKSGSFCQFADNNNTVLGYWKLNENSGINASDSSGNKRHGTTNNENWTLGKLNNCMDSNGVNTSINCGNFDYYNSISVEFWIYIRNNISRNMIIDDWSNTPYLQGIFIARLFGVIAGYVYDLSAGSNYMYIATPNINENQWYHLVMVYNHSDTSSSKWYKNGVDDTFAISFQGTPTNFSNNNNFQFFNSTLYSYAYPPLDGKLDNVILYNRALSADEVKFQYNNSFGREGYPDILAPELATIDKTEYIELTDNATAELTVCDANDTNRVLLEFDGHNFTMSEISVFTYYQLITPLRMGVFPINIYLIDNVGNINVYSYNLVVMNSPLVITGIIVILLLIGLMIFFYYKIKKFIIIMLTFFFSIIFGMTTFSFINFPFTPYFTIFFMLFQSVFFILSSIELYQAKQQW